MHTKLKKINEGFTIVETLIVLAIAALIITIVLIAVPDLQRSARNTDILHDAQNVAAAVQSYESNNQGALPGVNANPQPGPTITIQGPGGTGVAATAKVQASDKVYFANYSSGLAIAYKSPGTSAGISGSTLGPGQILVVYDAECGTAGNTNTLTSNNRAVAVLYPIESGSGATNGSVACVQE